MKSKHKLFLVLVTLVLICMFFLGTGRFIFRYLEALIGLEPGLLWYKDFEGHIKQALYMPAISEMSFREFAVSSPYPYKVVYPAWHILFVLVNHFLAVVLHITGS